MGEAGAFISGCRMPRPHPKARLFMRQVRRRMSAFRRLATAARLLPSSGHQPPLDTEEAAETRHVVDEVRMFAGHFDVIRVVRTFWSTAMTMVPSTTCASAMPIWDLPS